MLALVIPYVKFRNLFIPTKMPYRSTTLEPMRAQSAMSTVSNGTGLHTRVGGRRGLGDMEGREILLGTSAPDCRHQWQSQKEQVKV